GRPDEAHGEEVVAFVELRSKDEADADELVAWSKERIGGYKYPREVHVVPSLPLTPVGKIDRKALRARILEEAPA
nr:acyl-CoA synthetase [Actinomycetota bacterium]